MSEKKRSVINRNNIWRADDFRNAGIGKKLKLLAMLIHFIRCIKWSRQRIVYGFAECDVWDMDVFLQRLIPEMLQTLRETHHGAPAYLGEIYTNEDGIIVNDSCHEEWDGILDKMIFLWRESYEETCSRKNPYDEEYYAASEKFYSKCGFFGDKESTDEEGGKDDDSCGRKVHFMDELPEYKEISAKHKQESEKLDKYRSACKDEAIDMLKEHFSSLWD